MQILAPLESFWCDGDDHVTPSGILKQCNTDTAMGMSDVIPSANCNSASLDQAANSAGSGSSFTISGIGSPTTIRAGRPLRVSRFTR